MTSEPENIEQEKVKCNLDNIQGLTQAAKEWLLQVSEAISKGNYRQVDAMLVYAARIISRLSL